MNNITFDIIVKNLDLFENDLDYIFDEDSYIIKMGAIAELIFDTTSESDDINDYLIDILYRRFEEIDNWYYDDDRDRFIVYGYIDENVQLF
jgi:hypothetical protein